MSARAEDEEGGEAEEGELPGATTSTVWGSWALEGFGGRGDVGSAFGRSVGPSWCLGEVSGELTSPAGGPTRLSGGRLFLRGFREESDASLPESSSSSIH